jgi:hypothetical protein
MFTTHTSLFRITLYQNDNVLFSLRRPADTRHTLTIRGHDIVMLHSDSERLLWTATDHTEAREILTALTRALHACPAGRTGRQVAFTLLALLAVLFMLALLLRMSSDTVPAPVMASHQQPHTVERVAPPDVGASEAIPPRPPAHIMVGASPTIPLMPAPAVQPQQSTSSQPHPTLSPEAFKAAQKALASNLKNAADKKYFTIPLSTGHQRTLYVFADPLCPHCRTFEPALQALSASVNITVFPVTLIGKADTTKTVVPVLCAPYESRPVLWRRLFDEGTGMLNIGHPDTPLPACEVGRIALQRNDKALVLYHLPGTPTVISDDGRMVPLMAMSSVDALNAFLKGGQ